MPAIRLTFDIADGKPIFKSSMRVNMRIPPEQKISNMGIGSGIWLELRDPKGNCLYRRVIDANTFQADTEIRTGTSDRPLVRRKVPRAAGAMFHAVIPDDPKAKSFHILERRSGKSDSKPKELYRLDITALG